MAARTPQCRLPQDGPGPAAGLLAIGSGRKPTALNVKRLYDFAGLDRRHWRIVRRSASE